MNGHIKQRLVELFHTQMYRLLQLLLYRTVSCIQKKIDEHDKQRLFFLFVAEHIKHIKQWKYST